MRLTASFVECPTSASIIAVRRRGTDCDIVAANSFVAYYYRKGIIVMFHRLVSIFAGVLLLIFATTAAAQGKGEYVLGPGDLIKISVFQNPDLTVDTRVSESGLITFPLIGSVEVGGLTTSAAEQKIARQLREGKFVLQPQVNILVAQVRGSQVAVLGEVTRPGRYPLEVANMKVSDALALAGGVTPAGGDSVVLVGTRSGQPFRREIDLPALFRADGSDADLPVSAGDKIYVHRAPQFYIYGEVKTAGGYRLDRGMTVMQGIAKGGGVTLRGTERGVKLHRRDKNGTVQVLEPRLTDEVQPEDVIYVRESLF